MSHSVWIDTDSHGLPVVGVDNQWATARISLQGGNVMEYTPRGEKPVLWVSSQSYFAQGKPIRGGVPICWPWFGAHPSNTVLPAHGFARLCLWSVAGSRELSDGSSEVTLKLNSCDVPPQFKAQSFLLHFVITVGSRLTMALEMTNTGTETLHISGALHTYFNISDIDGVSVDGLDGARSFDSLTGREVIQQGSILFNAEFDRVFLDTESECVINDPGYSRKIRIAKSGSRSAIVWNPWIEKAKRMPDFGDDEYRTMLCVETANARDDRRAIAPGATHTLKAIISKENL
jgi:D-hexose-6-phosphate mutarotase